MSKADDSAILMDHVSTKGVYTNPCACADCLPYKVHHWVCDGCGAGPFRFLPNTPGTFRVAKPMMTRMTSRFDQEANGWVHTPRHSCSKGCVEKENGVVTTELIELAGKRPDLREAAMAQVTAIKEDGVQRDDLDRQPDGGSYQPTEDDL